MIDDVKNNFNEYCCVFRLANFAINNTKGNVDDLAVDWSKIYAIAHELSFIVLVKQGIDLLTGENKPSKDIYLKLLAEYKKQIIIDSNQLYELEKLERKFEEEKINMLLLKGSSIKPMYPYSYYRYMGDIDTLVEKSDFNTAHNALTTLGYKEKSYGSHDRIYTKEPFISLEQHFTISEGDSKTVDEYYNNIWQKAKNKAGFSHIFTMTNEDIYIYLSVHAVHHINYAGISARIFLDYYVFLEKYRATLDMDYINRILASFGYVEFNKRAVELAYKWFSPDGVGLSDNATELFVASSSTYGTTQHNIGLRTARLSKNGKKVNKFKFILKQLFPPYSRIRTEFPVLRKCPLLLPFVWVLYVINRIKKTKTKKYYSSISDKTAVLYNSIITDLGLNNL
ncbi:MAG: nucleotidyltransferase family protein [Acutalibacteraceae bacterium]|nr:nucleotidyltransferase family protein [Acutalibacteraceae bacterium]